VQVHEHPDIAAEVQEVADALTAVRTLTNAALPHLPVPVPVSIALLEPRQELALSQLVGMGFDASLAKAALEQRQYNVALAVAALLAWLSWIADVNALACKRYISFTFLYCNTMLFFWRWVNLVQGCKNRQGCVN
jgi:hypothetical protein